MAGPPKNVRQSIYRMQRVRPRLVKSFPSSVFLSDDFLFLLGVYQETQRSISSPLQVQYVDWRDGECIGGLLAKVFDYLPSDLAWPSEKKPHRRRLIFHSEQVSDTIKELTEDNTCVPHHLIGESIVRKKRYLQGYLYRGMSVTSVNRTTPYGKGTIDIRAWLKSLEEKKDLVHEVGSLLRSFSVDGRYTGPHLYVGKMASLQSLLDHNFLRYSQRDKLQDLLNQKKDLRLPSIHS